MWGELSWGGGNVRVGLLSRRDLSWRELSGGNCPREKLSQGDLSRGEVSGENLPVTLKETQNKYKMFFYVLFFK